MNGALNGARHALLHFELMMKGHFLPQKGHIIEIAITSLTQQARLQGQKKKKEEAITTPLIYPGTKGHKRKEFVSFLEMSLLSTLIKQRLKMANTFRI